MRNPEEHDVVVLPNMFGDIATDLASVLQGGLGMAASANVGEHHMMFEPVHGSAPRHSGMNKVNPIAMIASVQLMLAELGARHEDQASRVCAELLDASIAEVIGEGNPVLRPRWGRVHHRRGHRYRCRPRSPSDVHVLRVAMIEIEDHEPGIRVVRFGGEVAPRAFTVESLDRIVEVVSSALREEAVRGLVLIGTGRFFLAGADVRAFQDGLEQGTVVSMIHELTGRLHPLELEMRRSSTVCIARDQRCRGRGGLGIALACDGRVASPGARLATSYARLGLSPDGGSTWLLPRLVGEQVARRFFFENEVWNAEQALDLGAIDDLVPEEDLLDPLEMARRWSRWSAHFREATKHLLDVQSTQDLEQQLDHERLLIKAAGTTAGFIEGVDAFLSKRDPSFL